MLRVSASNDLCVCVRSFCSSRRIVPLCVFVCVFLHAVITKHKQHSASLLLPLAVSKTECVCRPEWRRSPAANYSSRKTKGRSNGNVSASGANESETLQRKETRQMNEGRRLGF